MGMPVISEIYGPVAQGEGAVLGTPTVFVRTGGCDYRCGMDKGGEFSLPFICDTLYAVLPDHRKEWKRMSCASILKTIQRLTDPPMMITLSGGNPALQDLSDLITEGHREGYTFAIETQGTKLPPWAHRLDIVTVSPKPPSSGMETNWDELKRWLALTVPVNAKIVLFNEEDFEYARKVRELCRQYQVPVYLQVGTEGPYQDTSQPDVLDRYRDSILTGMAWLIERTLQEKWYDVKVLPQLHALIHGAKRAI